MAEKLWKIPHKWILYFFFVVKFLFPRSTVNLKFNMYGLLMTCRHMAHLWQFIQCLFKLEHFSVPVFQVNPKPLSKTLWVSFSFYQTGNVVEDDESIIFEVVSCQMPNVSLSAWFLHTNFIDQLYLFIKSPYMGRCGKVREKDILFIFVIVE